MKSRIVAIVLFTAWSAGLGVAALAQDGVPPSATPQDDNANSAAAMRDDGA